jgi:hypothetical protein
MGKAKCGHPLVIILGGYREREMFLSQNEKIAKTAEIRENAERMEYS